MSTIAKQDEVFEADDVLSMTVKCPFCKDNPGFRVRLELPMGESHPWANKESHIDASVEIQCPLCNGNGEIDVDVRWDTIEDTLKGTDDDRLLNWVRANFIVSCGSEPDFDSIEWE